jgi:hypothetical protein
MLRIFSRPRTPRHADEGRHPRLFSAPCSEVVDGGGFARPFARLDGKGGVKASGVDGYHVVSRDNLRIITHQNPPFDCSGNAVDRLVRGSYVRI